MQNMRSSIVVGMEHPVLAKLATVSADLDVALTVTDESRGEFSTTEITEAIRLHKELTARLDAVGLNLLAEAAATDVPFRAGAPSTAAWLSGLTKLSPHAAKERASTSAALENLLPDTKYALETGRICYEQAAAIAAIITDLPKGASAGQVAQAEQFMLDRAPTSNGHALRRLRKRVDDLIDPEGLLERERAARKKCGLTDKDNHDGTHTLTWTVTDERYAKWRAAIEPLAAPRPAGTDGTADPRTREQRLDDAMNDLLDRVLRHGGNFPTTRDRRPTVILTIDADALQSGTGLGTTTTGVTLTAQATSTRSADPSATPTGKHCAARHPSDGRRERGDVRARRTWSRGTPRCPRVHPRGRDPTASYRRTVRRGWRPGRG